MKKKIKIGKNGKVNIKWKVLPIDYTKEAEEDIKIKFASKYDISKEQINIEPLFIKKGTKDEEIHFGDEIATDIQRPPFQRKLFKSFIKEKDIKCEFEKIVEIDDIINSFIDYDQYETHKNYTLKWIKWSNFMSYGENNEFDYQNLNGIVLLSSNPANQGGKTTFSLDLFRFLLFGKVTSREDDWTLSKLFNRHKPEVTTVTVEGCVCIDGVDYVIKREVTRPALKNRSEKSKVSQKVTYYKLVNDEYLQLEDDDSKINETEGSTTETNKLIKEAIGNERDFDLMICVNADNLKNLITLKDAERGRLITRWIGLLPLEEKDKIAREYYNKNIIPSLISTKYNKEELKIRNEELEKTNKEVEKLISDLNSLLENKEKELNENNNKKDNLLQSKYRIDDKLVKYDKVTIEKRKNDIINEGKEKKAEKNNAEGKLIPIKDIEFNESHYKELTLSDKEKSIKITEIKSSIKQLKSEIEILQKGEYCPTCGAKLANVDNTSLIKEKEEEKENLLNEGVKISKEIQEIQNEIKELDEVKNKYNEKLKLELLIQKLDIDIESLRNRLKECNNFLKEMEMNEEAIKRNNDIDSQVSVISIVINTINKKINELNNEITLNKTLVNSSNNEINKNNEIISKIEKEEELKNNWKAYLELIGKNGISKMVLRNALPIINGELNFLLKDVCDFQVEVDIDDRNDVNFILIHDGVRSNLGSGSGFEQTVASLALRSVLFKISSFSKPSFVVLDEVLGGVAYVNYDQLKLLYDKMLRDYQFIFQISHVEKTKEWANYLVTISKNDNISKISSIENI